MKNKINPCAPFAAEPYTVKICGTKEENFEIYDTLGKQRQFITLRCHALNDYMERRGRAGLKSPENFLCSILHSLTFRNAKKVVTMSVF